MPQPQTIVITGASAGIGAAIARRLAADGHSLALAARREGPLNEVAREAERLGSPKAMAVPTDVTKRDQVQALADRTIAAFGAFDVWINNAGRGITRSVLDLTDEELDEMMAVNLKSALYGMQIAARHFLARGRGQIINVSSFLGRVPLATHRSAYNAAKAALNALTANLRVDLRTQNPNIHVTLVMPGLVATEFARNALGGPSSAAIPSRAGVQSASDVAEVVSDVIATPVAEVFTNPASAEMAVRYFADIEAFEMQAAHPWRAEPPRA